MFTNFFKKVTHVWLCPFQYDVYFCVKFFFDIIHISILNLNSLELFFIDFSNEDFNCEIIHYYKLPPVNLNFPKTVLSLSIHYTLQANKSYIFNRFLQIDFNCVFVYMNLGIFMITPFLLFHLKSIKEKKRKRNWYIKFRLLNRTEFIDWNI